MLTVIKTPTEPKPQACFENGVEAQATFGALLRGRLTDGVLKTNLSAQDFPPVVQV